MLRFPRAPWVLLALLTIAHLALIASFVRTAYSAPDADGYYAQARMLVLEGRPDFEPESPVQHLGMHWLEKEDGRFISRYPPGLSIVIGFVWKVFGRDVSLYVNAFLAALTLPLVFLLCRPYAGDWLALLGALIQGANPAANSHALSGDSHTLTTFCLVLGLVLLDRWRRHGGRFTPFAAGFALAYIPLVRFAEAAAAVGIIAFLALLWSKPERRQGALYAIGGALIPALALAAHNQYHFGAFWRTAYALTGESNLSLAYLLRNWATYGQSLLNSGVGYFIAPAVLGLFLMWQDRELRPMAAAIALINGAITFLYCCYYFADFGSPVNVRFLLPTLPLYLPPALNVIRNLPPRAVVGPAAVVLTLFQITMGQPMGMAQLRANTASADRSAAAVAGMEEFVPAGSVLFGERRLNEQLHFTGEWKLASAELVADPSRRGRFGGGGLAGPGGGFPGPGGPGGGPPREGGPDADRPSPMQRGKGAALRARYEELTGPDRVRAALEDAEVWAGSKGVYLVVSDGEQTASLPPPYELELAGRIEMPEAPENPPLTRRSRRGFRPGMQGRRGAGVPGGAARGPDGLGDGPFAGPQGPGGGPGGAGGSPFGLGDETLLVYRVKRTL